MSKSTGSTFQSIISIVLLSLFCLFHQFMETGYSFQVERIMTNLFTEGRISCFKCNSRNNSHSGCHDPFHPVAADYEKDCKVAKKGHEGYYPASFCIKVIGSPGYLKTHFVCLLIKLN